MSVKISKTNTKLGAIPSVNLPPITTCRENCPCIKDCYAMKGRFRFKSVKERLSHNLISYLQNPSTYFSDIKNSINNGVISYSYFRWHASGDIISERYFYEMVKLARELPNTSFLAFTKKYEIVNKYMKTNNESLPDNLIIVFSAWGNQLKIQNPFNFPVAHVRFKDEELNSLIPISAKECSGNCTDCLQCWNIKKGESVVFNKH